jgi:hypothetical protein
MDWIFAEPNFTLKGIYFYYSNIRHRCLIKVQKAIIFEAKRTALAACCDFII